MLAESAQVSDTLLSKYALAVFAAMITGLVSYLVGARLEAKKNRKVFKKLSWDMDVESSLLEVKDELREKVQIRYGSEVVGDLTTVGLQISNTGGAPVFNEFLRFSFPSNARILEVALDPVPEPELEVEDVTGDDTPVGDRRFRIGHLEPGQTVQFRVISEGGDWANWEGIHPKNDEGGVEFQRGDVSRVKEDQEHVKPFLVQAALLVFVQLALVLNLGIYIDTAVQFVRITATIVIVGLMLSHLAAVARIAERIIIRYATGDSAGTQAVGRGNSGNVIYAGSVRGDVVVSGNQRKDDEDEEQ